MGYIYEYDIAAIVTILTVMVTFYRRKTVSSDITTSFSILLSIILVASITDLISSYMINNPTSVPLWLNYLFLILYYISNTALPLIFYYCITIATGVFKKKSDFQRYIYVPFLIVLLLIFLSPVSGVVFYFDADLTYKHGFLYPVIYLSVAFYLVVTYIVYIKHGKNFSPVQKSILIIYTSASVISIVLQLILQNVLIVCFVSSVSALIIYFSLENPNDYMDKEMGIFNRFAFLEMIKRIFNKKKDVNVIAVQLMGIKYLSETIGEENRILLLKQIVSLIKLICGKKKVFRFSKSRFVIVLPAEKKDVKTKIEKIKCIFEEPLRIKNFIVPVSVRISYFSIPDDVNEVEDIVELIETSLDSILNKKEGTVVQANKVFLESKKRENYVINVLQQAYRNNDFEILYQPIYSIEDKKYISAEALIRLKNPELKSIGPKEFIPLAEKNGMILRISEFVMNSVCDFIKRSSICDKYLNNIHINLSAIQCMQNNFANSFLQVIDSYDINHKYITFDVNEATTMILKDNLLNNIDKLKKEGICFSLDDFGSAFSNTANLVNFPFDVIKIDKELLWNSSYDDNAKTIMQFLVKIARSLNKKVVAEGVESENQLKFVKEMNCDFIQGYLYSRPLKEKELIELLESEK